MRICDSCGTDKVCPTLGQVPVPESFKGFTVQQMCEFSESPKKEEEKASS